jgi:DNA-binding transcriptional MerR regulator
LSKKNKKKLDKIKTRFSIADMANLSGVPADTIRKWESRHRLLRPSRSGTNIRRYDLGSLKKLLSVAGLLRNGYKLSRLAAMTEAELETAAAEINDAGTDIRRHMDALLSAMLGFDRMLFEETYRDLLTTLSFPEACTRVLFPFLHDIGTRWQSNTITPAHEHFISNLVCQKLHAEAGHRKPVNGSGTYVLFLPLNEMHEIGLLFLHCMLLRNGMNSVYLGAGIDLPDLDQVKKAHNGPVTYVTWLTVSPHRWKASTYLGRVQQLLAKEDQLLVTGAMAAGASRLRLTGVKVFPGGSELLLHVLSPPPVPLRAARNSKPSNA